MTRTTETVIGNTKLVISALPEAAPTGWGTAGRRIVEELRKLTEVRDLNEPAFAHILMQDFPYRFTGPLLTAIRGVDLLPMYSHLSSTRRVGYCFIEDNVLMRRYALNLLHNWEVIATGSTWATSEMQNIRLGMSPVVTAIQGVDHDVFAPNKFIRPDPGWFTIFSGGKFEYRKSQDVVIRAVAVMMERHKDVRLLANWWNPWPASEATMSQSKLITYPGPNIAPRYEIVCQRHGIDIERARFIEKTDHKELALAMNIADIGVFANRCEAGTNLVLMEAMACGMPVIATRDHGHADVTGHLAPPFVISTKQFPYERDNQTVGLWYEPNLDDLIDKLQYAYSFRNKLAEGGDGLRNYAAMKEFTWAKTARVLLDVCMG